MVPTASPGEAERDPRAVAQNTLAAAADKSNTESVVPHRLHGESCSCIGLRSCSGHLGHLAEPPGGSMAGQLLVAAVGFGHREAEFQPESGGFLDRASMFTVALIEIGHTQRFCVYV